LAILTEPLCESTHPPASSQGVYIMKNENDGSILHTLLPVLPIQKIPDISIADIMALKFKNVATGNNC